MSLKDLTSNELCDLIAGILNGIASGFVNICDIYREVMVSCLLHHSILDGIGTLALPFLKE